LGVSRSTIACVRSSTAYAHVQLFAAEARRTGEDLQPLGIRAGSINAQV